MGSTGQEKSKSSCPDWLLVSNQVFNHRGHMCPLWFCQSRRTQSGVLSPDRAIHELERGADALGGFGDELFSLL